MSKGYKVVRDWPKIILTQVLPLLGIVAVLVGVLVVAGRHRMLDDVGYLAGVVLVVSLAALAALFFAFLLLGIALDTEKSSGVRLAAGGGLVGLVAGVVVLFVALVAEEPALALRIGVVVGGSSIIGRIAIRR